MPTLAKIGEDALLDYFAAQLPAVGALLVGPGDDCAVVAGHRRKHLLKTDAMVEGVHYLPGTDPVRIGHKAVARVFSDIAAMGGAPTHVLVTLALAPSTPFTWVEEFYRGARALCTAHQCTIAGGELTRVPPGSPTVISIAATGRICRGAAVLRSGGQPGDVLAVTGMLGNSLASGHHLDFQPRLAEGQWLARRKAVHAMMDLSDGIAKDLPRLARASACAFHIDAGTLPMRPGADAAAALADGEDYELLICIRPGAWKSLHRAWRAAFPEVPLTPVGTLLDPAGLSTPVSGGWDPYVAGP